MPAYEGNLGGGCEQLHRIADELEAEWIGARFGSEDGEVERHAVTHDERQGRVVEPSARHSPLLDARLHRVPVIADTLRPSERLPQEARPGSRRPDRRCRAAPADAPDSRVGTGRRAWEEA